MARSPDFGWVGSHLWARGKGLETLQKANLGRKWIQTEDEGKSSCEKLWVVLGVALVVAVCRNNPLELNTQAQMQKPRFWDLQNPPAPAPAGAINLGSLRTRPCQSPVDHCSCLAVNRSANSDLPITGQGHRATLAPSLFGECGIPAPPSLGASEQGANSSESAVLLKYRKA